MSRSSRSRRVRRSPPGTPPGQLHATPSAAQAVVRAFAYGPAGFEERRSAGLEEIAALRARHPVVWIDVAGTGDTETIAKLGDALGLHRLALEDVVHLDQRPKIEEYAQVLFIVARMQTAQRGAEGEQLSVFLGDGFVATFQEQASDGDCLDSVRERIRQGRPRIREGGAAFLAYAILDAVVDGYFPVVEQLGDRLELCEEQLLRLPTPALLADLHRLRRDLLLMRRSVWPLRDVFGTLLRSEDDRFEASLHVYLRDCHDHAIRLLDFVETYRELAAGLLELYVSMMSHRLNEVMKVLTLVATIFIPLSFLASLWGMNFDTRHLLNMPELRWKYGYLAALGVMACVSGGMVLFFRRRGFL
ncbi:MAG: magnesium/cobalt transporter CorA [bacterium]